MGNSVGELYFDLHGELKEMVRYGDMVICARDQGSRGHVNSMKIIMEQQ